MGWNGSDAEKVKALSQGQNKEKKFLSPTPTHNFNYKALIAGLIVIILGSAAVYFITGRSRDVVEKSDQRPARIAEVKPHVATNVVAKKKKDPKGYYNGKPISESNRPPWMSPYHRIIDYGPTRTNQLEKSYYEKVFSRGCNQQIAELIDTEPGTSFIGECGHLYKNFDKHFLASIEEPIIIKADDPDDVKAIKQAVIDARLELKDRYDRGENLQKVMEDTWNSLRELGVYKQQLEAEMDSICKDSTVTEAEVDDYIKAANKMLEDRGCTAFPLNGSLKRQLMRRLKWRQYKESKGINE